jgi:hypothetical protein
MQSTLDQACAGMTRPRPGASRIKAMRAEDIGNRIIDHLKNETHEIRSFAAQSFPLLPRIHPSTRSIRFAISQAFPA